MDESNTYGYHEELSFAKIACENDSRCIAIYDTSCDQDGPFVLVTRGFMTSISGPNCIYKKKNYDVTDSRCLDVVFYKRSREYHWSFGHCLSSLNWLGIGTYHEKCCVLDEINMLTCSTTAKGGDWSSTMLTMFGHRFCDDLVGKKGMIRINISELSESIPSPDVITEIDGRVYENKLISTTGVIMERANKNTDCCSTSSILASEDGTSLRSPLARHDSGCVYSSSEKTFQEWVDYTVLNYEHGGYGLCIDRWRYVVKEY